MWEVVCELIEGDFDWIEGLKLLSLLMGFFEVVVGNDFGLCLGVLIDVFDLIFLWVSCDSYVWSLVSLDFFLWSLLEDEERFIWLFKVLVYFKYWYIIECYNLC